jgi:hypothetical protein
MSETQVPPARGLINDVLPQEILGAVFEEHATLEWRAPAIDGRVCRLWRQIVLSSPRAWAYLEIRPRDLIQPYIGEFVRWLRRSGAAPLHIRMPPFFPPNGDTMNRAFYNLVGDSYTRIASLRMQTASLSFFNGRDFPCMRVLDVREWFWENISATKIRWGSMPCLHSLRLGRTEECVALLDSLPPLKILALYNTICVSLTRHSRSLTSLSLQKISWSNTISGPVDFPSLSYLSLDDVNGLKPHINASCLATYHEGGSTELESFSAPLHSLVEYGVDTGISGDIDITRLNDSFPNITRIAIRSYQSRLISLVAALAQHPHALPAVQTISAEGRLTDEGKRVMEESIRARSEACQMDITLHFTGPSFKISPFFAMVSHASRAMVTNLLTYITESRIAFLTAVESRVCHCSPRMRPTRIRQ